MTKCLATLLTLLCATAHAQDAGAPPPVDAKRPKALEAAEAIVPTLIGRKINPAVFAGIEVCELKGQLKGIEAEVAQERAIGKESGVVDLANLHQAGELIVAIKGDLKATIEKYAKRKVKPLPCTHPQVVKLASCDRKADETCAMFAEKAEGMKAASIDAHDKDENGASLENLRGIIAQKWPDIAADTDAKVAAALAWLAAPLAR